MSDSGQKQREEIKRGVLDDITPGNEERREIQIVFEELEERATDALDELGFGCVELVGSTARDTWLSGDRDIDVFLLLPTDLDREEFQEVGLDVGREVLPDSTVAYAEHPYVRGSMEGYDVDLVPCYDLDSTEELKSAVDRTPFHRDYVKERGLDGDQVRLLKAFLQGGGLYGSELKTRGFSGYLCELLVLEYGGFEEVVREAATWGRQTFIDPGEKRGGSGDETVDDRFDSGFVVVDPVDEDRNVAAVVSREKYAEFIDRCRRWLENPGKEFFYEPHRRSMTEEEYLSTLDRRGSRVVSIVFESPDIVEDQLYPQLRSTASSFRNKLEDLGFSVLRTTVMSEDRSVILLEFDVFELSSVERHQGPPVYVGKHSVSFRSKYKELDVVGPYIDDDRYVVEIERAFTTPAEFLEGEAVFDLGLGKHVGEAMRDGYSILVDEACTSLLPEFGGSFTEHFDPELH
ncbi:MAG: CCA tRNA nucleotidyltransferase [Halobacteria archaeon]